MRTARLLLALTLLSGCGDDEPSAPLADNGGGAHQVNVHRRDSGGPDDDDAGMRGDAAVDEPMAFECHGITALHFASDESVAATGISSPRDFDVTRQAATWRDGCAEPTIAVELSNGICPIGDGHELEILLSVNAIADGQIGLGANILEAERESAERAYRVRYTRPERFSPDGVFGSCDGAFGQISFYDAPDPTRAMNLRARFDFTLTPCDGRSNSPQMVSGYFDVRLYRDLSMVCPDR